MRSEVIIQVGDEDWQVGVCISCTRMAWPGLDMHIVTFKVLRTLLHRKYRSTLCLFE
jgi:hypothetical protein